MKYLAALLAASLLLGGCIPENDAEGKPDAKAQKAFPDERSILATAYYTDPLPPEPEQPN